MPRARRIASPDADGIDILPILRESSPKIERTLFWRFVRANREQKAVRSGYWKYLFDGGQYFLFDLRRDAGEREDLAARHPDLVAKFKAMVADWEAAMKQ